VVDPRCLCGAVGECAHVFYEARVEALKNWKKLLPHPRAQKAWVGVGWIAGVGDPMSSQMGVDIASARAKHGADSIAVAGGEHRQPPQARAAKKPHHQGLGSVVGVVARGNATGANARRSRAKSSPAGGSSPGLQITAACDGNLRAVEWDVERSGKGFRHVELGSTPGPQPMVNSVREQAKCE
jgi:hypothetical protein